MNFTELSFEKKEELCKMEKREESFWTQKTVQKMGERGLARRTRNYRVCIESFERFEILMDKSSLCQSDVPVRSTIGVL